jgi:hypothetical protein
MTYILVVQDIIGYFSGFPQTDCSPNKRSTQASFTVAKELIHPRPIKHGAIKSRQKLVANIVRKKKDARTI